MNFFRETFVDHVDLRLFDHSAEIIRRYEHTIRHWTVQGIYGKDSIDTLSKSVRYNIDVDGILTLEWLSL